MKCPKCKHKLPDSEEKTITCPNCGSTYTNPATLINKDDKASASKRKGGLILAIVMGALVLVGVVLVIVIFVS